VTGEIGWIYTVHLNKPLGRGGRNGATHYTGWAHRDGLVVRLQRHQAGGGSAMLAHARRAGIGWHVGALCHGTRDDERRLKSGGHADRRCFTCRAAQS
jgi:hypothetical protein